MHLAFTGAIKDDVMDIEELGSCLMDYLGGHYAEVIRERYKVEPGGRGNGLRPAGSGRAQEGLSCVGPKWTLSV